MLTGTNTTIVDLESDTSYSVQVRARNAEGASPWSRVVTVKTNEDMNQAPEFPSVPQVTLDVPEDTSAGQPIPIPQSEQGNLTATEDQPDSATLTYSLEGRDASSFNIDSRSGQIRTRAKLNFEEKDSYSVRVKVVDGDGGSDSQNVIINVTDVDEPPSAPSAPRVTATADSGRSLDVSWNEPRSSGGPTITDYDIQYRKAGGTEDDWQLWPHGTEQAGDTTRTATITTIGDPSMPLESRTQYEVRVRAKNGEGDTTANWSAVGRGTTGGGNSRPSFDDTADVVVLSVAENTRAGQNVGSPVSASDADSNRLTYSLEGPGADSFTIVSGSGQMRTKSPLDHESRESYSVTVRVDDGSGRDNSGRAKSVTISVDDVEEAPSSPAAPRVVGIPGTTDRVLVIWEEPANKGNPVTDYDVHYGESGSGGFARWDHFGADRSTIITGLSSGTRYQVQVRAKNDEGTSEWSRSGSGAPNPDVANRNPAFSGGARTFSVRENTGPSADVGTPARATDPDGDTLTYTLEGPDSDSFYIISTGGGGQILTSAPLDHEQKPSYSVTVRVADGRGGSDTVNLTITVTDEGGEAPSAPVAPTATAGSSTSLQVRWDVPENSGPDIADYDYRYRESSESGWTEVTNTAISDTNVTISSLTPNTPYFVQVRAKSDEGTSSWSTSGIGLTDPPGANSAPEFSGTSASRSVFRSAPAGTPIGDPVTATDADTGDTLTYSLGGTDAASFNIDGSTGQLRTLAGVALTATSYTVTVIATDQGAASAEITVTINVTNRAPAFSSTTTTRSVPSSATAGTPIGAPVTATDADTGDTLTYTLEGADQASFRINNSTGQLFTRAALDDTSYTVTVVATDQAGDTARIAVTITVANRAPQFSQTSTTRTVDRSAPVGAAIGDPVTATDADTGDLLAYRLAGPDAASFRINSSTGQLLTRAGVALDRVSYTVTVVATDQADETASISVTINVANSAPSFSDTTATRSVERGAPAGTAIGDPVSATDADTGDLLAYSLGGPDRASFRINSSTGQLLTRAGVTLDAASYTVTVVATDELTASASIRVTITVPNSAPAFGDASASRSVDRSATGDTPVGDPVTASDSDPGDTLSYSLQGADAASFSINSSTGQLLTRAGVTLDAASYTVTVVATDNLGATASIVVTITVANSAPAFSDTSASRSVDRSATEDTPIGDPVTASDSDPGDTLSYSLQGADAASFSINSSTGQLLTRAGVTLDAASYTITVVAADDQGATASIVVTITVANAAPAFSDTSASRSMARSAPADTPIGDPLAASDADPGDTLAYSIEGDAAASFGIDTSTGQLLTLEGVEFDRVSYSVTVVATDELGATASIAVTITVANAAPEYSSESASRSVARNAPADTSVGAPVTAMDADIGDTLTYSLGGDDAASFGIDSSTGQMLTLAGVALDQDSYAVTVVATDSLGATATIAATITISDADSLLVRFDSNEDGAISQDEVFRAIFEFLSGQANRDEILSVILLFITQ